MQLSERSRLPECAPHFPTAEPQHRLKSTMTNLTAVDWGPGIQEIQVRVHKLIPARRHHRCDRTREPGTDTRGRGDGNVNVSFIRAPQPAPAAVWKHNCNGNSIDPSRFLLDKLHCFLRLSIAWRANAKEQKRKAPPRERHRRQFAMATVKAFHPRWLHTHAAFCEARKTPACFYRH